MSAESVEAKRRVANRLRRARGQLDAVISAVEADAPCRDVVTQLSAVTHALRRAGFVVVATAMEECLAEPAPGDEDDPLTTLELEKLFLSLA
ncbi:metal-sensitive transcriptional regulator [Microbacterium sp. ZW T5_45]|uniref:metal-sensitive transcriptional regulator n=1 Tax=Microbacterium sp. ZW T5_45 TaxID=3378080 RepID=UPI0038553FED